MREKKRCIEEPAIPAFPEGLRKSADKEAMEILRRLKRAEPVFDRRDRSRRNPSSTGESTS